MSAPKPPAAADAASAVDAAPATVGQRRALVIDDNHLNSRLVGAFLRRLGWHVQERDSGITALPLLGTQPFDLVLLDLRMPKMTGEQVCRAIREELGLTSLPVIAYTAHSMPEEMKRILAIGFTGLLIKPITFSEVRELCDAL